jgi:hypothetical protein
MRVQDTDASGRDRSEGKLFLTGHTEFSKKGYIEGCPKRFRNLERNRHTTAWNAEDYDVIAVGVLFKTPSQAPAGFCAICKNHAGTSSIAARN